MFRLCLPTHQLTALTDLEDTGHIVVDALVFTKAKLDVSIHGVIADILRGVARELILSDSFLRQLILLRRPQQLLVLV